MVWVPSQASVVLASVDWRRFDHWIPDVSYAPQWHQRLGWFGTKSWPATDYRRWFYLTWACVNFSEAFVEALNGQLRRQFCQYHWIILTVLTAAHYQWWQAICLVGFLLQCCLRCFPEMYIFVYICISVTKCGKRLHCNRLYIHTWTRYPLVKKEKFFI